MKRARSASLLGSIGLLVAATSACTEGSGGDGNKKFDPLSASASVLTHAPTPPAPPLVAGTRVSVVPNRDAVALTGPRVEAKRGDWMVETDDAIAIVSADDGWVIDYGLRNKADGIVYLESAVWDGFDDAPFEIASIEGVGGTIHVTKRIQTRGVTLHTWTWIEGATLRVDSVMVGSPDIARPALAVTAGEVVRWGNTPTFIEGYGSMTHGGSHGTSFLARSSQGLSYALSSLDGPLIARFGSPDFPGFWTAARTGESPQSLAPNQASTRRRIAVTISESSLGDAVTKLPKHADEKQQRVVFPSLASDIPPLYGVDIVHCEPPIESYAELGETESPIRKSKGDPDDVVLHAPFARYAFSEGSATIPEGCFLARLTARGQKPGPWVAAEKFGTAGEDARPISGVLTWAITDKTTGGPTPVKLVFRGTLPKHAEAPKPDDKPAPPKPPPAVDSAAPKTEAHAKSPPPTDDPDWGDDPQNGAASNAIFSADGKGSIAIPPGSYHVFVGRGPEYTLVERDIEVKANATVPIEGAIEHVVDTKGWISGDLHVHAIPSFDAPVPLTERALSLAGVGVEVVVGTDHNRITDYRPAIHEANLDGRLASVIGDEVTTEETYFGHFNAFPLKGDAPPPPVKNIPPQTLFDAMRRAGDASTIVQVNHPRMTDIGYFDLLRLDPARIDASMARSPLFDASFDAIEVFNGDHYANIPRVEYAMMDWYALLRAGKRVTATGNSDSHKVTYQDVGEPRNWVAVPNDDPGAFDEHAFVGSIRSGAVIVSNGPFLLMSVGGVPIGGTISPGKVDVEVEVRAPDWIDVTRVELVKNGRIYDAFDGPFEPPGKGGSRGVHKFEVTVAKGDWLVAIVRGTKPMQWLARRAPPFAFTNPIFVGP